MEGEGCPKLLDLIPRERDKWVAKIGDERAETTPDYQKLELKLGPPGEDEKKPFLPPQKRIAPGPVVGWPPIRSFRKNLATKSQNESGDKKIGCEKTVEKCRRGMFVKINMDGVPIGRKVDLKAYDSYEKLSSAVDQLFRGLLAAQKSDCSKEEKAITGVLDGSGEYTLVYEDNEGDKMLVGDVPWNMFVSTVKRLRVLKSSEVSALTLGSCKNAK